MVERDRCDGRVAFAQAVLYSVLYTAKRPRIDLFRLAAPRIPSGWTPYLPGVATRVGGPPPLLCVAMAASYRDLVRQLSALEPPAYIFGGVAEDVLFEGVLDRSHGDLDVLLPRKALPERIAQMQRLGFPSLEVYYEPLPGRSLVLGCSSGDLHVEFGIVDEDASGLYFVAGAPDGTLQRVEITGDLFGHPPVIVDGLAVHVASPLGLYQMREAFMRLGTFGPPREKDIVAQGRLREDFLERADEGALAPRMGPFVDVESTGSAA